MPDADPIYQGLAVKIEFPYEAVVLKARCSRAVPKNFVGSDVALIPAIDAPVGCRIHFPASKDYAANSIEIVSHDGNSWWPWETMPHHSIARRGLPSACVSSLRGGEDALGLLAADAAEFPTMKIEDLALKKLIRSDRDAVLEKARDKIERNLLVKDGIIFQRGGEPVYVQREDGSCGVKIGVAAAGAHRLLENGLKRPAGDFLSTDVQRMFRWGHFWSASDRRGAERRATYWDSTFPMIETVDPEATRFPAETIRIDALFHEALRISATDATMYRFHREHWHARYPAAISEEDDNELSFRRLRFLVELDGRSRSGFEARNLTALGDEIRSFEPKRRLRKYARARPQLTKAEEASLASLRDMS